ncbi:RNAP1 protein [Roseobacter phage RD-1410Ws-07]|uniref:RNAP1 protein n=2 Tax=Sanyabayvirus DS1410Ws06 TaxID=2844087 RepID=A0A191VYM1_9CAUD|nr:RNAP1 protein [Dinoroseobacter phage DS-1410Ws-06]ANJ20666.1 RNAP1 protein [Dinoroseobacter phage DS-1410Ws-06]ANJ20817.1 RNAP1 protein [Roseobacter phage RD-1410Ws-07]
METAPNMQETQRNLEELYSKNQLLDVLRDQFSPLTDDPFKLDVIVQIYLHKQADIPTMVGLFSPKWGEPKDVAQMLIECVDEDLLDFDMEDERFIMKYGITSDVEEQLALYQFPLPMVVQPKKVENNHMGSGYFDTRGHIVLNGSDVFRDEDVCLDHINRANSVGLTLNIDVVASPEGNMIIPKRKVGEDFEDFRKRRKQAEVFYNNSMEVMQGMLALGNQFWLTHKYDRRGRTYAVGYHINSQGTDYNKAVLELAKKETLT